MAITAEDKRFGTLVLPYDMKDIAYPKEIMVNYSNGHIFVKSPDGTTEISITKTLENRFEDLLNQVNDSESITVSVTGLQETFLNPVLNEMKRYIDAIHQGISIKQPAKAMEAHTNLTLSGIPAAIDGVTISANDVVMLNAQTNQAQNGKWIVKTGAWERPSDFDSSADFEHSAFIFIEQGTKYGDSGWVLVTDTKPIVVGTTPITFQQFTGAGQIIAGTGIEKQGNELRLAVVAGLTPGTYFKTTVDAYGRVTRGENPTTLQGFGITDATPLTHVGTRHTSHGTATASEAGFMSASQFTKLQNVDSVIEQVAAGLEVQIDTKVTGEAIDLPTGAVPAPSVSIIDNVTSTSTADALSARQGKLMNDRITKIGQNQNPNSAFDISTWIGTQAEYDALTVIDNNTMYYII